MIHLMIDLETLGTSPRAGVIQLGAVLFETGSQFRSIAELQHSFTFESNWENRVVDSRTLAWWQDEKRIGIFKSITESATSSVDELPKILTDWYNWIPEKPRNIWSNGANFDLPILRDLFDQAEMEMPWKYFNERCFRTVSAMNPGVWNSFKASYQRKFGNNAHNALFDARMQAAGLQELRKYIPK